MVMRASASIPAQTSFSAEIGGSVKISRFESDGVATSAPREADWLLRPRSAAGSGGGDGRYWGSDPPAEVSSGGIMDI